MPTISEWLTLTEKQRREFLEDTERFDSYSDEASELANSVAINFQEKYCINQAEITIGNKGGYLIIVAVLNQKEYEKLAVKNIVAHLGFYVYLVAESNS